VGVGVTVEVGEEVGVGVGVGVGVAKLQVVLNQFSQILIAMHAE